MGPGLAALDGSSNLDTSLPTGSIFGVYQHGGRHPFSAPGRATLVAAGYALYSSATELVLSLGTDACVGFVLDPSRRDGDRFVLARPSLTCPPRGPYYSLNDA